MAKHLMKIFAESLVLHSPPMFFNRNEMLIFFFHSILTWMPHPTGSNVLIV